MADENKNQGLATTGGGSQELAVPDFMREDMTEGKENLDLSSIRLPRLAIAQGLSHEIIPDDSAYIDGLKLFDLFNTGTTEIYGRGPLQFIPLQHRVIYIEWSEDGKTVIDRDVPPNDPRCQWTEATEPGKKGTPPRATKYTELGCLLIKDGGQLEPIVLSIKETNKFQTKAAERVLLFIANTPGPIYGSVKSVTVKSEKFEKGSAGVFVIQNVRILGKVAGIKSPALEGDALRLDTKLYLAAKEFYNKNIKGKIIDTDRQGGGDDASDAAEPPDGTGDDSFDTEHM